MWREKLGWYEKLRLSNEKLTRREKAFLAGGFLISVFCLFYFGWWQPHLAKEEALRAELAAQAQTAEYFSALEKNLSLYRQKKLVLLQEKARLAQMVPLQPDTAVYLRWLEKEAETAGVRLLKAADGGRTSREGFEEQVLQLTVRGEYEKIAAFAGCLENLPRLTGIKKVLLRCMRQEKGSSSGPGAEEKSLRGAVPIKPEFGHDSNVSCGDDSGGEAPALRRAVSDKDSNSRTAEGSAGQGWTMETARRNAGGNLSPNGSDAGLTMGAAPLIWEGVLEIVIWRDSPGAKTGAQEGKENTSAAVQEK